MPGARKKSAKTRARKEAKRPAPAGWATTDDDELHRRLTRGQQADELILKVLEPSLAPYGHYRVESGNRSYRVEIRSFVERQNSCDCADFRVNRLGTCKHIEAVLHHRQRQKNRRPTQRVTEVYLDQTATPATLRAMDLGEWKAGRKPDALALLDTGPAYDASLVRKLAGVIANMPAAQRKRWRVSSILAERAEHDVQEIEHDTQLAKLLKRIKPADDGVKLPLYPYQREGMLHLVRRRRAILADEMGLGKTVQAVAACALLKRLGLAQRVLIVCPASLKSEWEEQIRLFTDLECQSVIGMRKERLELYARPVLFTICNYEQVLRDIDDIQVRVAPDVVVLDEAQRIKNWRAKSAEAVKRLRSRYAFVLSGTPIENRIDEIYSIMQFIDADVLGPLFRFNREYYVLNERGHPEGYQRLDQLHRALVPYILRRTKADVEGELPPCQTRTIFTPMTEEQQLRYADHEASVARLVAISKRRALLPKEQELLQIQLGCMRMTCDSAYILDQKITDAPKLDELDVLLDELLEGPHKIIVFSEWTKMLALLQRRLEKRRVGYALHTGQVAQKKRRGEINRFKQDEHCRLFLSTESGGSGLNLQVADVVVNLDLPWNPAKLAQRVARAWRKHQTRSVQVINLVAENTIEHSMLGRLESKQRLADGVLQGGLAAMELPSGRGAMLQQVDAMLASAQRFKAKAKSGSDADAGSVDGVPGDDGSDSIAANWAEVSATALQRFGRIVRQATLQRSGEQTTLLVAAAAEHHEVQQHFTASSQGLVPGLVVKVIDPEWFERLQAMAAEGLISFNGSPEVLIRDGEPDASTRERYRLADALKPHQEAVAAAAMLESNGFAAQAIALLDGLLPALGEALKPFAGDEGVSEVLDPHRWQENRPSAMMLSEAMSDAIGPMA